MHSYALKFIMVGDSRVGKSQLNRSFTKKSFNFDSQSTIGMEFSTRTIEFEKCNIKAQLWDTAGQERFESMTKVYYRDAVGAALVFDISNRQSFDDLKRIWLPQLREYGHESMKVILVGNKADLVASGAAERQVSQEDAIEFASFENFDYVETSALTGEGVEPMFRRLVLASAKLLPDVKVNLELTGLPEGWISHIVAIEYSKPSVDRRLISEDAATSSETNSDCLSDPRLSLRRQSSLESYDSNKGTPFVRPKPEVKIQYINYWTGEIVEEIPTTPAPTKMLHEAIFIGPPSRDSPPGTAPTSTTTNNPTNSTNSISSANGNTNSANLNNTRPTVTSYRKSLDGSMTKRDSLKLRDYSIESARALTERSSSIRTVPIIPSERFSEDSAQQTKERKVRKCSNCVIQ